MTLLKKTEVYRVDTEEEAISAIKQYKDNAFDGGYEVAKASYDKKNKKLKGEIIDEWVVVSITFVYGE